VPAPVCERDRGKCLRPLAAAGVDERDSAVARQVERVPAQLSERARCDVDTDRLGAPLGRKAREE
jgi:hypothetical protein